eukprot:SAG11_NODE_10292_length_841_cov_2.518868_2_plen_71_part_01
MRVLRAGGGSLSAALEPYLAGQQLLALESPAASSPSAALALASTAAASGPGAPAAEGHPTRAEVGRVQERV